MAKFFYFFIPVLLAGYMVPQPTTSNSSVQVDGPYVWYANGQVQLRYILEENGVRQVKADSLPESSKDGLVLQVATGVPGQTFPVRLKKNLQKEKSEFKKVSKQYVISDIEGNLPAFTKLLQAGGVMDTGYNWTFGEGHLVLTGDFFDRGDQVTEVLWLIYSLEDKAKAAGGYVHFILGNHEIMNLSGDIRYVNKKYTDHALLLNMPYVNLFGEQAELGRWLRTKNILERVGDFLYVHGGISPEINRMDLTIAGINELAQPFYPDSTYSYPDPKLDTIFNDNGPFWYRGYYNKGVPTASKDQVDSTIDKFRVHHVVTGHTLVADSISSWFNGKVINADIHHAGGKSEALLIDDKHLYRVKPSGEKILLMHKKR